MAQGFIDQATSALGFGTPPPSPPSWQSKLAKPTFRGIPFYCNETSNGFGRRIAMHEYPQHDIPYAEDMGRKARTFNLDCYVIGDEW